MLDMKTFGEKIRSHRKHLSLSQEDVANKIGVSAQAVSKWENGECLPDCFNLKALGETYGISLDILLETEIPENIDTVSAKIEQLADEYIWANAERFNSHTDLGENLLKMWKGIYFIETGSKEMQERDKKDGNLRILSDYGMKVWDDDGVVAVVAESLKEKLGNIGEREMHLLRELATDEGLLLIRTLDPCVPSPKVKLIEVFEGAGIPVSRLNELLLELSENKIIEYVFSAKHPADGYKICGHFGIAAYLVMAAAFILSKPITCVSEYLPNLPIE